MSKTEESSHFEAQEEMAVSGPVTDSDSKTVMLAAERGDTIRIREAKTSVEHLELPDELEVIQRTEPYYGPKLFTHASVDGEDRNYLLTAPGPNSQLCLWKEEMSSDGKRIGWVEAAEITVSLAAEQPPYERCDECGEIIRSIEHERAALSGQCSRKESWN